MMARIPRTQEIIGQTRVLKMSRKTTKKAIKKVERYVTLLPVARESRHALSENIWERVVC